MTTSMTALENIVDGAYPAKSHLILRRGKFDKFAKAIRGLIAEGGLPDALRAKIPELNRFSFSDKLNRYIEEYGIVVDDFPPDAIAAVIRARNSKLWAGIEDGVGPQSDQSIGFVCRRLGSHDLSPFPRARVWVGDAYTAKER